MKKVFFLLLLIGLVFVGCEVGPEKSSDPPSIPTYKVQFDPYTPQTVSSQDPDFQGTINGGGFLTCTLCFFIHMSDTTTIWVLQHPSAGKIKIQNDSTAAFSINVPKWLEFQYGPDTEVIVSAVIMETGYGVDIVLANVVP